MGHSSTKPAAPGKRDVPLPDEADLLPPAARSADTPSKEYSDKHTVDLVDLMNGDSRATKLLCQSLHNHGWQVVATPPEFQAVVSAFERDVKQFYRSVPKERKEQYKHGRRFGYTNFDRKEVYRVMSGSELPDASSLPDDVAESLPPLVELLETTLLRLYELLELHIPEEDVPLLRCRDDARRWFALFDTARYFNYDTAAENCATHYDPGVLTLSVLSSGRGLKLYRDGAWYHAPQGRDRAIVWAGHAAHAADPRVQPAIHRVDAVDERDRFAAWMEMCTEKQVLGGINIMKHRDAKLRDGYIVVPNLYNGADPYRVKLKNGNIMETLHIVEALLGLPFSKSMPQLQYDDEGAVQDIQHW